MKVAANRWLYCVECPQ